MTEIHDANNHDGLTSMLRGSDAGEVFRGLLRHALQELIEEQFSAFIGAGPHERTETRTGQRNGHQPRLLSTPAGDIDLAIPEVRAGSSFFPELLEPRRRAAARGRRTGRQCVAGRSGRRAAADPPGAR